MARPKVFVSSTYYDLKHIRASLEVFIESLGFDAVLFEKGDIAFHPDSALDESCYREARSADIFVLIVGGRYGSAASTQSQQHIKSERYLSITQKEFEAAQEADVPTFILVDGAVHAEHQTFRRNRDNDSVVYAHVDSTSVFHLLEAIFELSRNNPVFAFERATDIESWLREQWAGLFRELLSSRSQQKQLTALNSQVEELQTINQTLKNYMEVVLKKVDSSQSERIIANEEQKLQESRKNSDLAKNRFYSFLKKHSISDEKTRSLITDPATAEQATEMLSAALHPGLDYPAREIILARSVGAQNDYNSARRLLGADNLDFANFRQKSNLDELIEAGENAIRAASTPKKPASRKRAE